MVESELKLLRHYELRLLRCTLPSLPPLDGDLPSPSAHPPPPSTDGVHPLIHGLISSIESGNYLEALSSAAGRSVFGFSESLIESVDAAEFYEKVERIAESFLLGSEGDDDGLCTRAVLVMSIGVAAFLAFVQCNVTGPVIELPAVPLPFENTKRGVEWEAWARDQLMSAGADLLGKFSNLQYIVYAKILVMKTKDMLFGGNVIDGIKSISWWLVRFLLLQQRILNERCSSLFDLLQVSMGESLHHFDNMEKVTSYWGEHLLMEEVSSIVSMVQLEAGFVEHTFGRVDSARHNIESAEAAVGLELSVTGVLGFRTVHQVEPKAQMVLVTSRSSSNGFGDLSLVSTSSRADAVRVEENPSGTSDTSDVLRIPRFVVNDTSDITKGSAAQNGYGTAVALKPMQQAVVMADCLLIAKKAAQDELQRWDLAPYIEAIDSQKSSPFVVRCFSDILRIRWESTRGRTRERALMMMDKLVQGLFLPNPEVSERVHTCFGVNMPTVPAIRKEYSELLVSNGLVGEALKTFEDLELWDSLIYCYRLLEKKAAAVELIKTRLSVVPNDPRLWCSLGDVTNNDACYEKALEVSSGRSVRAKRSLARSAYSRGDYDTSIKFWYDGLILCDMWGSCFEFLSTRDQDISMLAKESAMALNSLYPDGWFALGTAALKIKDFERALDSFTRAVQLDPENGEAWNNIACLHMIKKRNKEAVIAFKEALKFKRNIWQMWENYSHVAADASNFSQAIEAFQMVLDLTGNKRIDAELLKKFVVELEKRASLHYSSSSLISEDHGCGSQTSSVYDVIQSRETEHLMQSLGKIFHQIVRINAGGDTWGLYARWHRMKGDLTMCSESLLKQVRAYQGSEVWKDADRFKKLARASVELCKVYLEISASTGSLRELQAAEMHLRNVIGQADAFSDTEEFKALEVCVDDVRSRRDADSIPTA